jgi:FtsZ-interacting cell division protein YlmF
LKEERERERERERRRERERKRERETERQSETERDRERNSHELVGSRGVIRDIAACGIARWDVGPHTFREEIQHSLTTVRNHRTVSRF